MPLRSELTLSSDIEGFTLARAYVRELATIAEFPPTAVEQLMDAVGHVCGEIVQDAFDPGEEWALRLTASIHPDNLTLSIFEQGLPFDESAMPKDANASRRSRAWDLVDDVVDEVHWLNHGKEGSELQLIKNRPEAHIDSRLAEAELQPAAADEERAAEQEYVIRRLGTEEAIQVSRCFYRAYGYSYPNDDVYYPQRMEHLNETGRLISAVAVDAAGEVIGHLALERHELGPVAESGQAVVMPAHRGRHLMEQMRKFLEEEGRKAGLVAIWSEPVTSHAYSQRANEEIGSRVCGLSLAAEPQSVAFKKIESAAAGQRESCMFYVQYLVPPPRSSVHAPKHHRAMIERIFSHLNAPLQLDSGSPPSGAGEVAVSLDRAWGDASIRVHLIGRDTAAQVRQARKDLVETSGAEVVYLELPLADVGTPTLCKAAEDEGFFFSGIAPQFASSGDVLRLQYVIVPVDISHLAIASDFGKEIAGYVAQERERVGSLSVAAS